LFDPDLTEVGVGAIVGSGVSVVAHSLTRNPDGTRLLTTAPIMIGPRVVIGGDSLISLGVTIGADAIIEPMSHVKASTRIPAGEVWGGVPAVFRRKRFETGSPSAGAGQIPREAVSDSTQLEDEVRRVVAAVMHGIVELVHLSGKSRIEAEFVPGPRNQPIIDFLQRAGFVPSGQGRYALNASTPIDLPRSILWVGPTAG